MLPPELAHGLARARAIVGDRKNPLVHAAARLPDPRARAFFALSYASMRLADDLVDEQFLALPPRERGEERALAFQLLSQWQMQLEVGAGARNANEAPNFEPELFCALGYFLQRSSLGMRPWQRLARALRRDLQELPIRTWPEYLEYCEGACVAPATVFVYLLGAEFAEDGSSRFALNVPAEDLARPLAIFAYLVHLVRDLKTDAARDAQLVHVPRAWFANSGVDFDVSLRRLAAGSQLPEPVATLLFGHLESAYERAIVALQRAEGLLLPEAYATLEYVVQCYVEAWGQLRVRPVAAASFAGR